MKRNALKFINFAGKITANRNFTSNIKKNLQVKPQNSLTKGHPSIKIF